MATIDTDFDVYKSLTNLRETEDVTYNDVLRRLLKLPPLSVDKVSSKELAWASKGYRFSEGTEFLATYGGRQYLAEIKKGKLMYDGKPYNSLSGAAKEITGGHRNGWDFWMGRAPGSRDFVKLHGPGSPFK